MKLFPYFLILLTSFSVAYYGCQSDDQQEAKQQGINQEQSEPSESLKYIIPEGWIEEQPRSTMRRAQFRLPGQEGSEDAEMAVFVFPGTGGSVRANIDRWIGQFSQPDGSSSAEKAQIEQMQSHGLDITTLYLTGTFVTGSMGGPQKELENYAILAAIVETSGDPWFFKATGPARTINLWKSSFKTFLTTMKETDK